MSDQSGSNKKLRPKRKTDNLIKLLNSDINDLNISITSKIGLKAMGIDNLSQLRERLTENNPNIKQLGLRSREELQNIFKKNEIPVPSNWIWR